MFILYGIFTHDDRVRNSVDVCIECVNSKAQHTDLVQNILKKTTWSRVSVCTTDAQIVLNWQSVMVIMWIFQLSEYFSYKAVKRIDTYSRKYLFAQ